MICRHILFEEARSASKNAASQASVRSNCDEKFMQVSCFFSLIKQHISESTTLFIYLKEVENR